MTYMTDVRANSATFLDRIATMRADFQAARAQRKIYNTTVAELSALSNRDLNDLGIGRSMIHGIAHEAAYGK